MGTLLHEDESCPAVAQVRSLLNRKLRVKVTDGRVFYGYLNCFDKKGNIILLNATECRPDVGYVTSPNAIGVLLSALVGEIRFSLLEWIAYPISAMQQCIQPYH